MGFALSLLSIWELETFKESTYTWISLKCLSQTVSAGRWGSMFPPCAQKGQTTNTFFFFQEMDFDYVMKMSANICLSLFLIGSP